MTPESDRVSVEADAWLTLKKYGKTFAWAAHLMRRHHANRLTRLYALCRMLDDLADLDGGVGVRRQLLALREDEWHLNSADPIARELASMVADIGLNPSTMHQLLDGLIGDLDHQAIADEKSLVRYAYLVAGTVGLMVCDVLDVQAATARSAAVNLGIAMQLTNIARDVHEDAISGRRYLPITWWNAEPADIMAPSLDMQRKGAIAVLRLLNLADCYYAGAQCGFPFLPLSSRIGLAVAANVYQGIGAELRRRGGAFYRGRVYVSSWRKVILTVAALGKLAFPVKPAADLRLNLSSLDVPPHQLKAVINGSY